MVHEKEMIRWAKSKEDTRVWYQIIGRKNWRSLSSPAFSKDCRYVVDDEFAEIRKAFIDGEKIQMKILWANNCSDNFNREWTDYDTDASNNINGSYNGTKAIYRIKPRIVKKYKVAYHTGSMENWEISSKYYTSTEEFKKTCSTPNDIKTELIKGSVREFNENDKEC